MDHKSKRAMRILGALSALVAIPLTASAHDPGPGMLITCPTGVSGVPFGAKAAVVVHNAATGAYASSDLGSMDSAPAVCLAILNTAIKAGLRAQIDNGPIAIYGAGNSVSVSFATINKQDF
jgi:hypothetical protein